MPVEKKVEIDWKNLPDDVLYGFSRPGSNPWTMSYRKERLLKLQQENPLMIYSLPKNKNLKWAQDRIFILSFPDWQVEQVNLDLTPIQHQELATNKGEEASAAYIVKKEWVHFRSLHKPTGEELAISLLVRDYRDHAGYLSVVRRQGVGMLDRSLKVPDGLTVFILPDIKSFTVKASTLKQLREAGLRIPSRQSARPIPLIK